MGVLTVANCTDQYGNYLVPNVQATADIVTWNGDGDGVSWSDDDNWDTDTKPTSTQTAYIDSGSADIEIGSETVGGIETATGFTGTITMDDASDLVVKFGGMLINAGSFIGGATGTLVSSVGIAIGSSATYTPNGITVTKNADQKSRFNQQKDKRYVSIVALDSDGSGELAYYYTYKFYFSEIEIGADGSSVLVSIVDSDLTNPEDYSIYGLSFDQVLHARHFFAVVEMDSTDDKPTEGDAYLFDKNIVFSGFNKTGWALSTDRGDMFTATYTGMEQLFDEVYITGCMSYMNTASIDDANFDGYVTDMSNIKHQANSCIFNPNGQPNKTNSDIKFTMPYTPIEDPKIYDDSIITFNNAKLQDREYFTLKDAFLYLKRWYFDNIGNVSNLVDSNNQIELHTTFDRLDYMSAKILISENDYDALLTELETIELKDFSFEGVGVYSALHQILALSKTYMMSIKYDGAGVANLIIRQKNTTERPAGQLELTVSRSDYGEAIDSEKIFEDTTLYGTRELGRVGRVILEGAKVQILTLITNFDNESKSFGATFSTYSADGKTYGAPFSHISDFAGYMTTSTRKLDDDGNIYFDTSNFRMYEDALIPLTANQLNETTTQKIFKGLGSPRIERVVPDETDSEKDMGIYLSLIVGDGTTKKPYYNDGSEKFITVVPSNKHPDIAVDFYDNGFILKNQKKQKKTAQPPLTLYSTNDDFSFIPYETTALPFQSGYLGPLFVRCLVETDYRIKGIAEISGFDPEIHETIMLRDEDIELYLRYKDAYYDNTTSGNNQGTFQAVADGFITGHAKSNISILQNIQATAEAILNKYQTLQNSGVVPLKVVQPVFMVGDYISEIEGGNRTVTFPATINRVVHNTEMNQTNIYLGALN